MNKDNLTSTENSEYINATNSIKNFIQENDLKYESGDYDE